MTSLDHLIALRLSPWIIGWRYDNVPGLLDGATAISLDHLIALPRRYGDVPGSSGGAPLAMLGQVAKQEHLC